MHISELQREGPAASGTLPHGLQNRHPVRLSESRGWLCQLLTFGGGLRFCKVAFQAIGLSLRPFRSEGGVLRGTDPPQPAGQTAGLRP